MPLSEHEQRLLEQMERALYAEDPKFATSLRGADPRTHHRRRIIKASIGFVAGIALLLTGVITKAVPVAVLGFLLMLVSLLFAISSLRQMTGSPDLRVVGATGRPTGPRAAKRPRAGRAGLMSRFEERWNRRRDQNGR